MNKKIVYTSSTILILVIASIVIYKSFIFNYKFQQLAERLNPKILICLKQHKYISSYKFTKDETKGIEVINSFDPHKISIEEDTLFAQLLADNCTSGNIKRYLPLTQKRLSCRKIFYEYEFFKSALQSVKTFKWTRNSKLQIQKKIIEYINFQAQNKAPFLNLMVSVSLLKLLFDYKFIAKNHEHLIAQTFSRAERDSLRLRGAFRNALENGETPSCNGYIKYHNLQIKMSHELAAKILEILKVIK